MVERSNSWLVPADRGCGAEGAPAAEHRSFSPSCPDGCLRARLDEAERTGDRRSLRALGSRGYVLTLTQKCPCVRGRIGMLI